MEEKLNLLLKSSWNYTDIQNYLGVGRAKAINIRNKARKEGGPIPYKPYDCKIDTVLGFFGQNRETDLYTF